MKTGASPRERYFDGKLLREEDFTEEQQYLAAKRAHRPFKIVYASLYYDVRPTFVVDITDQFETRLASLLAYASQYNDQAPGAGLFPLKDEVRGRMEAMARHYGLLAGVKYAEPFVQKEVGLVDDLTAVPVASL